MKQQIYLLGCLLSIELLTGCGEGKKPPPEVVTPTPTPTPIVASPPSQPVIPSVSPTALVQPSVPLAPLPPKVPTNKRIKIAAAPQYPYPTPTSVDIPINPITIPAPAPAKTKAIQKEEPVAKIPETINPAQQITPIGIGDAKIGMSFKDLKQQMGNEVEFPIKTNFINGFDAIAVTKAGKVQYYIPYPSGTKFTDEDQIRHLMTDNPNYRTDRGIGPGTTIKQAASVYGSATLSLSKENESREFVNFNQHPTGIAFRPKPGGSNSFAGDYPESNESYLKTQKYDAKSAIGQITVSEIEESSEK